MILIGRSPNKNKYIVNINGERHEISIDELSYNLGRHNITNAVGILRGNTILVKAPDIMQGAVSIDKIPVCQDMLYTIVARYRKGKSIVGFKMVRGGTFKNATRRETVDLIRRGLVTNAVCNSNQTDDIRGVNGTVISELPTITLN